MVEYTQLSKGMFSSRVASEREEKTEVIRKDDKKIVLRIFFSKIFQFPFSAELSRGDLIVGYPYFATKVYQATGTKTGVAEPRQRRGLATPVFKVLQTKQLS